MARRSAAMIEGARTLSIGDRNNRVSRAQDILFRAKLYDGPIDGRYTRAFSKAVCLFQARGNLAITGDINAATWAALVE